MAYLKPQSPLKNGEDHVYPLTTYDQIIMADGSRWNGEADINVGVTSVNGQSGDVTIDTSTLTVTMLTDSDLNTIMSETPKFYYAGGGNACTNNPESNMAFGLYVYRTAGGYRCQELFSQSGKKYYRLYNGSWQAWQTVYTTSNKPTCADIGAAEKPVSYSATLTTAGWSSSAPYTQAVTVTGILATDMPIIDLNMSSATTSTASGLQEAWACVGRVATSANTITAYCYEEKPSVNIPLNIMVTR